MKMYEILAVQDFYPSIQDQKLPIKTAYKLTRLGRRIEEELDFYQREFQRIINDYAQKENGQLVYSDDRTSIKIIPGKEEECTQKIAELRNLEISLNEFNFDIDEFSNINLTISQMNSILPFINN